MKGGHLAAISFCSMALLFSGCGLINYGLRTAVSLLPIKLLFTCLPEGTAIDTPTGSRPVESLHPGDQVTGFNGRPVRVMVIQGYVEESEGKGFLKIEFENGGVVDLCKMHRIDGIRAGNLAPGQKLACGQVVKSIAEYGGVARSYDILTEDAGYRIGGVPVNSMIEEMYEAGRAGGKMKD